MYFDIEHCLQKTILKVKVEKGHFLQEKVTFLGHQISAKGIATDPRNISAKLGAIEKKMDGVVDRIRF